MLLENLLSKNGIPVKICERMVKLSQWLNSYNPDSSEISLILAILLTNPERRNIQDIQALEKVNNIFITVSKACPK